VRAIEAIAGPIEPASWQPVVADLDQDSVKALVNLYASRH
jgi:hypothetical protein